MNSRERIRTIISGQPADRVGFWLGNPHADTWPIYHEYFGTSTQEELRLKLGDDYRWIPAGRYVHPEGKALFEIPGKDSHAYAGPFANATDVGQLDEYEWPRLEYLDFTEVLEALRNAGDYYRASGFWTPFYHNVMDLFGMQSYLINMYENPALVEAVTDRVCQFYYEANELFFAQAGDLVDGFFFGNDFGTQRDLICGPVQFDRFVMPWFKRFTEQGHRHGYQVILHSCGSIYRVIDRLIEAGVDCLHPLQALAAHMDAETLARNYKGRIAFLGGIDTQQLLVHGTPDQIAAEVRRVKALLGPCLIVSPSHEALLPNVSPENVAAMAASAVADTQR
jgi:uroporphyrinogen decarboxylase